MIKIYKNYIIFINKNNHYHRENGPAIIYADGFKFWYQNGLCHRKNGPAIVYSNGYKAWYINDSYYTEKEYYIKIAEMDN